MHARGAGQRAGACGNWILRSGRPRHGEAGGPAVPWRLQARRTFHDAAFLEGVIL